ncbi:DUF1643 domain-containing protein [Paenibacillus cellulositrophicus]|uniref:DUF1643 domain-containing protein n=1 Tax=Paenibacillus cellulositrophicus TaxID=562959 RepID=UPI003D968CAA
MSKSKKLYNLVHVEPENYIYFVDNHRYGLTFSLKERTNSSGNSVAIIQMNGSSAGWNKERKDWNSDSTIGKVLCWCKEHGYETVHFLNLWSYVDKDPKNLKGKSNSELNKPENDMWIQQVCNSVNDVILAYGNCVEINYVVFEERKREIAQLLKSKKLFHVGDLNGSNNPKHGRAWNGKPKLNEFKEIQTT